MLSIRFQISFSQIPYSTSIAARAVKENREQKYLDLNEKEKKINQTHERDTSEIITFYTRLWKPEKKRKKPFIRTCVYAAEYTSAQVLRESNEIL